MSTPVSKRLGELSPFLSDETLEAIEGRFLADDYKAVPVLLLNLDLIAAEDGHYFDHRYSLAYKCVRLAALALRAQDKEVADPEKVMSVLRKLSLLNRSDFPKDLVLLGKGEPKQEHWVNAAIYALVVPQILGEMQWWEAPEDGYGEWALPQCGKAVFQVFYSWLRIHAPSLEIKQLTPLTDSLTLGELGEFFELAHEGKLDDLKEVLKSIIFQRVERLRNLSELDALPELDNLDQSAFHHFLEFKGVEFKDDGLCFPGESLEYLTQESERVEWLRGQIKEVKVREVGHGGDQDLCALQRIDVLSAVWPDSETPNLDLVLSMDEGAPPLPENWKAGMSFSYPLFAEGKEDPFGAETIGEAKDRMEKGEMDLIHLYIQYLKTLSLAFPTAFSSGPVPGERFLTLLEELPEDDFLDREERDNAVRALSLLGVPQHPHFNQNRPLLCTARKGKKGLVQVNPGLWHLISGKPLSAKGEADDDANLFDRRYFDFPLEGVRAFWTWVTMYAPRLEEVETLCRPLDLWDVSAFASIANDCGRAELQERLLDILQEKLGSTEDLDQLKRVINFDYSALASDERKRSLNRAALYGFLKGQKAPVTQLPDGLLLPLEYYRAFSEEAEVNREIHAQIRAVALRSSDDGGADDRRTLAGMVLDAQVEGGAVNGVHSLYLSEDSVSLPEGITRRIKEVFPDLQYLFERGMRVSSEEVDGVREVNFQIRSQDQLWMGLEEQGLRHTLSRGACRKFWKVLQKYSETPSRFRLSMNGNLAEPFLEATVELMNEIALEDAFTDDLSLIGQEIMVVQEEEDSDKLWWLRVNEEGFIAFE